MTKIWVQSMTSLEDQPEYLELLRAAAKKMCAPGTIADFHGVLPETYPADLPPIDASVLGLLSELNSLQVVESVITAQREGYDAVAMSCFGDPRLDICRSLVDIPVVSAFETSLLVASTSARAFGLLVPTEQAVHSARRRVRHYGFEHRVAIISACEPRLTESEMEKGFKEDPAMVDKLVQNIRRLAAQGADLIIPAEGVLNALLVKHGIASVDGVPVFDSFGSVIATADMLVQLHQKTGLRNARRGLYRRPDDRFIAHARSVAIKALTAGRQRAAQAGPHP